MKKVYYLLTIAISLVLLTKPSHSQTFSQYFLSEDSYCTILEYSDWIETDIANYEGKYIFIYPAQDEFGEYVGDGYSRTTIVKVNQDKISTTELFDMEAFMEEEVSEIENMKVSGNVIEAEDYSKKFVSVKYKTKSGKIKTAKGLWVRTEYETYFQERENGRSGGKKFSNINSSCQE